MKILNELYNSSCIPNYHSYKKITGDIILIDNFFKNFNLAKNFFTNRDIWDCVPHQGHHKSGSESILPEWTGKSLMKKYVLDNKIEDYPSSYTSICNFSYSQSDPIWSLSNSNLFPHCDGVERGGILQYICLINLNLVTVSTKFYSFKNKEYCDIKKYSEWNTYHENITKELFEYYNKESVTIEECKLFLDYKKQPDVKLTRTVTYKPNQAIVYPANLFHSADVTPEFSKNNPRALLRIGFFRQIKNL